MLTRADSRTSRVIPAAAVASKAKIQTRSRASKRRNPGRVASKVKVTSATIKTEISAAEAKASLITPAKTAGVFR